MSSIKSIVQRRLRKLVTSFYDPLVTVQVGNQVIQTPLSHSLKENVAVHPQLNFNLGRIVGYITADLPTTKVIDIGANVGDTVAYIRNYSNAPILCIDGDEKYLRTLKQNVAQYKNVYVVKALVGAENARLNVELKSERGTAFLTESKTNNEVRTLEDILKEFPDFVDSNVLKIDTDGFDAIILQGSRNYLVTKKPVLFFEYDPSLIVANNGDPFALLPYLQGCGYRYFIFYMSNGDYLASVDIKTDLRIVNELIHFFSGRNITLYTDICAFAESDKLIFDKCVQNEIQHYKVARKY